MNASVNEQTTCSSASIFIASSPWHIHICATFPDGSRTAPSSSPQGHGIPAPTPVPATIWGVNQEDPRKIGSPEVQQEPLSLGQSPAGPVLWLRFPRREPPPCAPSHVLDFPTPAFILLQEKPWESVTSGMLHELPSCRSAQPWLVEDLFPAVSVSLL